MPMLAACSGNNPHHNPLLRGSLWPTPSPTHFGSGPRLPDLMADINMSPAAKTCEVEAEGHAGLIRSFPCEFKLQAEIVL